MGVSALKREAPEGGRAVKRGCLLTSGKGLMPLEIGRKARFGGVSPWKSYQAQVSEQRAPCQGSPPKRRRLPACPRVTTLGGGCGRLGVQRARAVTKASATAQKRHRLPVTSVLSQRTLPGPAGRVPGPWARPPPQRRAGGARAAERACRGRGRGQAPPQKGLSVREGGAAGVSGSPS